MTAVAISACVARLRSAESPETDPGGLAQHHWALEDPGASAGSDEEILNVFRKTREELQLRLAELLEKSL